jgi:CheY-like chemotaxis protein
MTTILLVEDDDDFREALGWLLARGGYDVESEPDGASALEHLRGSEILPDVILVDLSMPVMGGRELCAELASQPDLAVLPVVLISASEGLEREKCATYSLQKPFTMDALHGVLARAGFAPNARVGAVRHSPR